MTPSLIKEVKARANTLARWLFLFASIVLATQTAATPTASEREIKAAIVYRVAKFIEWPASAFASNNAAFVICVVGDADAVRAFETISGRTLGSHPVTVRRVTGDTFELRQCHAAFFSSDAEADVDYALNKLKGLPVLTIGEAENFAHRGGILALLTRDERVKFALNLPISKQAGLTVSSQLLQLAVVVGR